MNELAKTFTDVMLENPKVALAGVVVILAAITIKIMQTKNIVVDLRNQRVEMEYWPIEKFGW